MGAHSGSAMGWDTNENCCLGLSRKNHLQRILFAKMLSDALKLTTVGKDLPHQMWRGWNLARIHDTGHGAESRHG